MEQKAENRNLPTIQELYAGDLVGLERQNALNVLLNQPPKKEWLKEHPIAKDKDGNPVIYIPIERVEYLLTRIFVEWWPEVLREGQIANSVYCTVRVHYRNVDGQMKWLDGVGAAPLQTKKEAGPADWMNIKSAAVQIGLPAAKSYAIKDAVEPLGKLFGKDLNRADKIGYDNLANKFSENRELLRKAVSDALGLIQDVELHGKIVDRIMEAEENHTDTPDFYKELLKEMSGDKS